MSGQIEFYRNHNGKVTKGTKVLPNDYSVGDVLSDLFTGSGCLFDEALHMTPRAHNREVCSERFPVSSYQVDKETKVLNIDIAACGIKKDEVTIDIDNDTILVKFNKSQAAKDSRLYVQKGLRLITDETLKFHFDPMFHDAGTVEASLEDGILTISVQPRAELKPIKRTITLGGVATTDPNLESHEDSDEDSDNE